MDLFDDHVFARPPDPETPIRNADHLLSSDWHALLDFEVEILFNDSVALQVPCHYLFLLGLVIEHDAQEQEVPFVHQRLEVPFLTLQVGYGLLPRLGCIDAY